MSKIICDVCGTSYPETASQCPICGSARSGDVQVVADSQPGGDEAAPRGYQYVKGGRFSNKNVHKHNSGKKPEPPVEKQEAPRTPKQKSNKPLIIVTVVLLLCVLATAGYIAIRFFVPADLLPFGGNNTQPAATTVPCMSLQVSQPVVELTEKGATYQIAVTAQPQNTTDTLTYQSSDPAVATVDSNGLITAVAPGQTVITVFCGDVQTQCAVRCTFQEETEPSSEATEPSSEATEPSSEATEPSSEATEPSSEATEPQGTYMIRTQFGVNQYNDVTIAVGDTLDFQLTDSSGNKVDATFTVKEGSCCTFTGNRLTAVSSGIVTVSTTYGGQEYTFIVRVS